jgi:hypothetical protein
MGQKQSNTNMRMEEGTIGLAPDKGAGTILAKAGIAF